MWGFLIVLWQSGQVFQTLFELAVPEVNQGFNITDHAQVLGCDQVCQLLVEPDWLAGVAKFLPELVFGLQRGDYCVQKARILSLDLVGCFF